MSSVTKTILWSLSAIGITAGLGPAIYNSIDSHAKGQDSLIQNISEQYQKNRFKRLECLKQQEIFLNNSKEYTINSEEMLLIITTKQNGKITQKAQNRLSELIEKNTEIIRQNSNGKMQDIILCQQDVINNYRQIMIDLKMIKKDDLSKMYNHSISYQEDSYEEANKIISINLQAMVNRYFDSNNTSNTFIPYFKKMIDFKKKEEKSISYNIANLKQLSQQLELEIENEISNRKNDNIFEKWIRAIF